MYPVQYPYGLNRQSRAGTINLNILCPRPILEEFLYKKSEFIPAIGKNIVYQTFSGLNQLIDLLWIYVGFGS